MASMSSSLFFFFFTFLVTVISSEARDFLVGGKPNSWRVPTSDSDVLNSWAAANRFQVGDSLVWRFDAERDSVLRVTRNDYLSCNMSSPMATHKEPMTVVSLPRSGAYYFISGAPGSCEKGERLIVVVMSERHRQLRGSVPAPAPTAPAHAGPAIAPSSEACKEMMVGRGGIMAALVVLGMVVLVIF